MSSVFSMEPEGITRAWPMVPLISRNASATQNHATISRTILALIGSDAADTSAFWRFSDFTFHRHRPFRSWRIFRCIAHADSQCAISVAFAHFELHQVRRINARVTGSAKCSVGVAD